VTGVSPVLAEDTVGAALAAAYGIGARGLEDPEYRYFDALSDRVSDDPADFADWIDRLARTRLRLDASHAHLRSCMDRLRHLRASGALGAFAFGEVAQICLADLVLIEDLAADEVPAPCIAGLRDELLPLSLDLVGRLVKNLARKLEVRLHKQVRPGDPQVRPLRHLIAERQPLPPVPCDGRRPVLLVLTAGRGTRLRTTLPKALVPVGRRPMIARIVDAVRQGGIDQVVFLLGHRATVQVDYLARFGRVVVQHQPEGTAHSALTGLGALPDQRAPVVMCFSDGPFLTPEAFRRPLEALVATGADFVVSTHPVNPNDDTGRVERASGGRVVAIAQPRLGATPSVEGDGGVYAWHAPSTLDALGSILNANVRYEYALPDVVAHLADAGKVIATTSGTRCEYDGVNTPADLVLARLRAEVGDRALTPRTAGEVARVLTFFEAYGGQPATAGDQATPPPRHIVDDYIGRTARLVGPLLDLGGAAPAAAPSMGGTSP
jgi:dTDP-glucose pyrophosphorylase